MSKNTGVEFEDKVYRIIADLVKSNEFIVGEPHVRIRRMAKYYSLDRDSCITFDIAVEKYLGNPDEQEKIRPALIILIECKDYSSSIPVDDVEEFHAKLQQIGADNTKGIMLTHKSAFQKSALKYAASKGIALARILPDDQVHYILHMMSYQNYTNLFSERNNIQTLRALMEQDFSSQDGEDFFSLTGEICLKELLCNLLKGTA